MAGKRVSLVIGELRPTSYTGMLLPGQKKNIRALGVNWFLYNKVDILCIAESLSPLPEWKIIIRIK